jgi:hypothetical protein
MKKINDKKEAQEKKKRPYTPPRPEEEKKKEKIKKGNDKEQKPFIQIDRGGNIFTNFFSNFLKQLKNPKSTGLSGLLGKLLVIKIKESEKEPVKPSDIMGPVKTDFRYVGHTTATVDTPRQNKSLSQNTSLSNNTVAKPEQDNELIIPKSRKPRLGM